MMWKNQTDQQQYQSSKQVQPAQNHGAHELFDVQETLKSLIGAKISLRIESLKLKMVN